MTSRYALSLLLAHAICQTHKAATNMCSHAKLCYTLFRGDFNRITRLFASSFHFCSGSYNLILHAQFNGKTQINYVFQQIIISCALKTYISSTQSDNSGRKPFCLHFNLKADFVSIINILFLLHFYKSNLDEMRCNYSLINTLNALNNISIWIYKQIASSF